MTRTSKTGRSSRGFTLLELLVALVIMVLMTGVVAVAIAPTLREARLRAGARTVVAMLRYARSYAIAHQTDVQVRFDRERQGLVVQIHEEEQTGEAAGEPLWRSLTTPAGRFRALPEGITIVRVGDETTLDADEDPTVAFSALGQGEETSILLRDARAEEQAEASEKRNDERTIQVDGLTGRCSISEDDI